MESDEIRSQLRESERGEAASWLAWAPQSGWHTAFFTVWTIVFALNVSLVRGTGAAAVNLALTLAALVFLRAERRRAGTYPDGSMPAELRRPVTWSMALFGAVLVATWVLALVATWWLVAALGGLATWVVMSGYARAFEQARERVESRLAVAR